MCEQINEQNKDVASNFMALLSDFNYADEMELLNISKLNFIQRKNLSQEFEALFIALWYSCLQISFPNDYKEIFKLFIEEELPKKYKDSKLHHVIELTEQYIELLADNASTDLTPIGHHILSLLQFDETIQRAYTLKIALHLRKVYTYIFERLI